MNPISKQEIPKEIMKQLGSISLISFPRQGHTSDVGIIDSTNGRYVLKRTKGRQYSEWLRRESYILDCLTYTSLRVPRNYSFIHREETDGYEEAWLLMEFIQGETLRSFLTREDDSMVRYEMIHDYGRNLRELHSVSCPDELKKGGSWIDQMLSQAEFNMNHYEVDGNSALLEILKRNRPSEIEQTLIHGDFTIDNVLVQEGRVTGIIDWSGGAYGDPRYDAALAIRPKPNIFQSKEDFAAFYDGYGQKKITGEEYEYYESGLYAFF
ncbi:phosphotransferase [Neobacillus mesonae]|nr:phosphotransferase [Neobacillus mesonae]